MRWFLHNVEFQNISELGAFKLLDFLVSRVSQVYYDKQILWQVFDRNYFSELFIILMNDIVRVIRYDLALKFIDI